MGLAQKLYEQAGKKQRNKEMHPLSIQHMLWNGVPGLARVWAQKTRPPLLQSNAFLPFFKEFIYLFI